MSKATTASKSVSIMENANRDFSICSVDKESILIEHDYCRSAITCDSPDKRDDHGLAEKSTSRAVEKLTNGRRVSVQVCDVDDRNGIVDREIAVQKHRISRFLSEKLSHEIVYEKLGIPSVMGDFFSRPSTKPDDLMPDSPSKGHKKSSTRTLPTGMAARREEKWETTSRERFVFESGASSSYGRQNVTEDSGMISHGSDLSESITPDFEQPRDFPMQSRPDQYLTPAWPPSACRQSVAQLETRDASIHSQPTQILAGVRELPDFRQAFGPLVPSNISNCNSPPPTSTPNYQLSDSQRSAFADTSDFELPRDFSMQSRPDQYLTPAWPPSACRQSVAQLETRDASIHSQPTQILAGVHELPDFRQAFGPLVPSNLSNCNSPPPILTSNYQLLDSQRSALIDTPEASQEVVGRAPQRKNTSVRSPPSLTPNSTLSDGKRAEFSQISFSSGRDIELGTPCENSNCTSLELFSAENYRSCRQRAAFTDTSGRHAAVNGLEREFENSKCRSPVLLSFENYPLLNKQGAVYTATTDRQEAVKHLETQRGNWNNSSPHLFSNENYAPSDNQRTALTDISDTRGEALDLETQQENSNSRSPELFADENYTQSDRQKTALTDRPDPRLEVVDFETQHEISDSDSSELFSNASNTAIHGSPVQSSPQHFPSVNIPRIGFTDTSDTRGTVNDLETHQESSTTGSAELFPTQHPLTGSRRPALNDTSDMRVEVVDLVSQPDNSKSYRSELFSTQHCTQHCLPSDRQGAAVTDASDRRKAVIDQETEYENSNAGSPVPPLIHYYPLSDTQETLVIDASNNPRSPRLEISPSITHEGIINLSNSKVAQVATNSVEFMDTQQVIDGETRHEYSNDSKITQSATVNSNLPLIQRGADKEIAIETLTGLQSIGSTQSITQFLARPCSVDSDDIPTQICTPFCDDGNESHIAINEQTPNSSRGHKRKREEEPESLWMVTEELSESGSPEIGIVNSVSQLSSAGNGDSRRISIGTNLPTPELLKAATQNLDNVSLDHSYSEPAKKSSAVRMLKFEGSQSGSCRGSAESVPNKIGKIQAIKEFSGSDSSNIRNSEQRRVRKTSKRRINFEDCKENVPVKRRRVRESTTPHRSTFDSNKNLNSPPRQLNLNDPCESHCTRSLDFSELLSNRCCEYNHAFPNLMSLEIAPYEPVLLKHLVETSYEEIKRNIDELVRSFESSDEDF